MSKKLFGFDKLVRDAVDQLELSLRATIAGQYIPATIESPIERLFYFAFHYKVDEWERGLHLDWAQSWQQLPDWRMPNQEDKVYLLPQYVIFDRWPVDFVVLYRVSNHVIKFAVECDGHEFHERTKEQASRDRTRDRRFQAMGFRVFRFTGSEIYRDPLKCADEVYSALCISILDIDVEPDTGRSEV